MVLHGSVTSMDRIEHLSFSILFYEFVMLIALVILFLVSEACPIHLAVGYHRLLMF